MITRALISVSDKTGLEPLATALHRAGVEILSTGGTARALEQAGVPVTQVSDHTGFPEIMAGRVKTLHPRIHGGILGRRGTDEAAMAEHDIAPIDLVVVNLYPFAATVARPGATLAEGIEQIDIGGPALLRAAAKNHAAVTVLCDPEDYPAVIDKLPQAPVKEERLRLAAKAFAHTARYDSQIQRWLQPRISDDRIPDRFTLSLDRHQRLRYGENPHQPAAVYVDRAAPSGSLVGARQEQGKPLSYNNLLDADAAWQTVRSLGEAPACVIVKHTNPCGVARGDCLQTAYERAYACDPTSSFGGIIAFNRPLDAATARAVIARQFLEVLIVPELDDEARAALAAKPRVRVLATGKPIARKPALDIKCIDGGWLVQQADSAISDPGRYQIPTAAKPDEGQWRDLLFAWAVVKMVRSNAIVYARDEATLGIGAGQMSRVDAARIAVWKASDAGLELGGAVMASDAFFPFADGIETAAEHGIRAVIQPGGSMRDQEVIDACNAHGIAMVMTGRRHFRH